MSEEEVSIRRLAGALERLATVAEKWYAQAYPEKKIVREATLTTLQTPEQKRLAQTIQGTESTLEEWSEIGPFERAFDEKQKKSSR